MFYLTGAVADADVELKSYSNKEYQKLTSEQKTALYDTRKTVDDTGEKRVTISTAESEQFFTFSVNLAA